jgi:hypothetical protein
MVVSPLSAAADAAKTSVPIIRNFLKASSANFS